MCYFSNALQYPAKTVAAIVRALKNKFGRTDYIVGAGVSGTLSLTPVSLRTGIPCAVVRKSIDIDKEHSEGGSHSSRKIETHRPNRYHKDKSIRYVIIDDFIDKGDTVKRIIQVMTSEYPSSQPAGIILYQESTIRHRRINNKISESIAMMVNGEERNIPISRLDGDIT